MDIQSTSTASTAGHVTTGGLQNDSYDLFISKELSTELNQTVFAPPRHESLDIYLAWIMMCATPFITIGGIMGNSLVLMLIAYTPRLRQFRSHYLLLCAICASTVILICVLLVCVDWWCGQIIYGKSDIGCRLLTYVSHVADWVCVWSIAMVTIDRVLTMTRPDCLRSGSCPKVLIALIVISMFVNLWVPITVQSTQGDGYSVCDVPRSSSTMYFWLNIMDTVFGIAIPSLILIIGNVSIIVQYLQYTNAPRRVQFDELSSSQSGGKAGYSRVPDEIVLSVRTNNKPSSHPSTTLDSEKSMLSRNGAPSFSHLRLTKTLAIVTSMFILMTLPSYLMRAYNSMFWDNLDFWAQSASPAERVAEAVTHLFYYAHYGVMFFVYVLWSPRSRWGTDLRQAFMKCLAMECLQPLAHKHSFVA